MVRGVYEIMISTRFGKKDLKLMKETFASLHGRVLDIGCGNLLDRVGFLPPEMNTLVLILQDRNILSCLQIYTNYHLKTNLLIVASVMPF